MGKFTVYDDKWIDEQIQAQLDIIVKNITATVRDRDISIFLSGGFGRGEGSVVVSENVATPLKDYDIWILSDPKIPASQCRLIEISVYKELGLTIPEDEGFRFSKFVIDVESTTIGNLNLNPDIFGYELKEASTLLYGKDVRNQITLTPEHVRVEHGLRLLFLKMVGLVGHFPGDYLAGQIDPAARLPLIYECNKTYVEIATALCILMGCYEPSFASRARQFCENFAEALPSLYAEVPELNDLVVKSTSFKLRPDLTHLKADPVQLWDQTRIVLGKVLRFYLNSCLEIEIDDWINLPRQACRKMGDLYYMQLANAVANKWLGTTNEPLSTFLISIYQKSLSYEYARRMRDVTKTFYWRPLLQSCSPLLIVFLTSPLVLYSLSTTGEIQKNYLDAAKKNLGRLIPIRQIAEASNWDDLRSTFILAYNLASGGR
jgi:hypothetical protein